MTARLTLIVLAFLTLSAEPARSQAPPWQDGFPLVGVSAGATPFQYFYPTIADVDGDGANEIVVNTTEGAVVLDGTGSSWPGWPYQPPDFKIKAHCRVGDVDGDGLNEIVSLDAIGKIHVIDQQGNLQPGWPVEIPDSLPGAYQLEFILFDVDGDGPLEIGLRGGSVLTKHFYAFRGDGAMAPGWPYTYQYDGPTGCSLGYPHAADLDFDGKEEFILGTAAAEGWSLVFVVGEGGLDRQGFPAHPHASATGLWTVAMADLDNDGSCEIAGYGVIFMGALRANGEPFWLSYPESGVAAWEVALGDLDGDGALELIAAGNNAIRIFDTDGTPILESYGDGAHSHRGVSLADFDGDGDLEIVAKNVSMATSLPQIVMYDHELNPLPGFPLSLPHIGSGGGLDSTAIGDLDGDGDLEVVFAMADHLYALDVPNNGGTPFIAWGQRGNTPRMSYWYEDDKRHFFMRGDANRDGVVDVSDVPKALGYLFLGDTAPCPAAIDSNRDGNVDIVDPVFLLSFLFSGGPSLENPFPACAGYPMRAGLPCPTSSCP